MRAKRCQAARVELRNINALVLYGCFLLRPGQRFSILQLIQQPGRAGRTAVAFDRATRRIVFAATTLEMKHRWFGVADIAQRGSIGKQRIESRKAKLVTHLTPHKTTAFKLVTTGLYQLPVIKYS